MTLPVSLRVHLRTCVTPNLLSIISLRALARGDLGVHFSDGQTEFASRQLVTPYP